MSAKVLFRRMTPKKIMEGVFGKPTPCPRVSRKEQLLTGAAAVHKPTGISSAQALRDLQRHFNPSELFAPLLEAEREVRDNERHNQRKRRKDKRIQVKIGHGGTLDPLATGVLIAGIGKGTKSLQDFLLCTKVYDTVVLFGTSTDTYDRVGKVLSRAPYAHITKEMVEEALEQFRGKFMQLPPLFSALKMDGKPLYEYAREGKEIPRQIERRPVEVLKLELIEWMEGGTHSHVAPTDEAGHAEINVANKLWKQENVLPGTSKGKGREVEPEPSSPPIKMEGIETGEDKGVSTRNKDLDGEGLDLVKPESQVSKEVTSKHRASGSVPEPNRQAEALLEKKIVEGREEVVEREKDGPLIPEAGKSKSWKEEPAKHDAILAPDNELPLKGTVFDGVKDDVKQETENASAGEVSIPKSAGVEGSNEGAGINEATDSLDKEGTAEAEAAALSSFEQKKRKLSEDQDDLILERPTPKLRKGKAPPASSADIAMMSGGLPSPSRGPATTPIPTIETSSISTSTSTSTSNSDSKDKGPPAVRLRMTVTSGFYVRSLCHDLGAAVGSAALMAELERTRQGEFELGKNVLEWEDLAKGEKVWGPTVEGALDEWHAQHGR